MKKISIVGLGYIGIPTSVFFARSGVEVVGIDVNEKQVERLNRGEIGIVEPGLAEMVKDVVDKKMFRATLTPEPVDAFIISVPTPFKDNYEPDLSYIQSAAKNIAPVLQKGNLIVLESTSPVGATEQLAKWLQESRSDLKIAVEDDENCDVYVAYCPERMIPGNVFELIENDRILGGINNVSTQKAKELYSKIAKGELILTNARTAEMSKLTENSFRDVNIAFANELSMICDKLNINVQELISLANHHPRVNILQPGCGVGGHCIAVDPWFIVNKTPDEAKLIRQAREVNDYKPKFVIKKVEKAIKELGKDNPSITCFGLAFKPNIDDLRESPALKITQQLAEKYNNVFAVEPNINVLPEKLADKNIKLIDLATGLKSDILLMLVEHKEFKAINPKLSKNQRLVDTRGIWQNA
ncbi:UDP-N-acetyl-D-mannosamine dehydrogenase [bacterium]|nr:UDP-N-acetyl-D-mannosamine dehydrogenase [bacterium]